MVPITPVEVTPGSTGAWVDVDITDHVGEDAGNVAVAVLHILNRTLNEHTYGIRANGSTDDVTGVIEDEGQTYFWVGVDENDIFEAYISDANVEIWLVGYMTTDEAGYVVNGAWHNADNGAWTDADVSSDTGDDTAVITFWRIVNTGVANSQYGLRMNGSTDDRRDVIYQGDLRGAAMACDVNEIVELYHQSNTAIDAHLMAWQTTNAQAVANAVEYNPSQTNTYETVDLSGQIPEGGNGAYFQAFNNGGSESAGAVRPAGSSYGDGGQLDWTEHQYGWVEIDEQRRIEWATERLDDELWVWGYTSGPTGGPGGEGAGQPTAFRRAGWADHGFARIGRGW